MGNQFLIGRGELILAANGADDGHGKKPTTDFINYLKSIGVKVIGHIRWASEYFTKLEDIVHNRLAIINLEKNGFEVVEIEPRAFISLSKKVDCLYFNGGNPLVLNREIKMFGLEKAIQEFSESNRPIVLCSAAAMALGTGNLSFLSKFAPKPDSLKVSKSLKRGMEFHQYMVIPHRKNSLINQLIATILLPLIGNPRIKIIPDGEFFIVPR